MARNNGKYLEDEVAKYLAKVTEETFHWERRHDAGAARNFFAAQPADFFMCNYYVTTFLECKSDKSTTRRLPKFAQHPRMLRWFKAGVRGAVLIHFHVPDEFFLVPIQDLELGKPSHVIDEKYKVRDVEDAVRRLLV